MRETGTICPFGVFVPQFYGIVSLQTWPFSL